jgi:hypothetical protein
MVVLMVKMLLIFAPLLSDTTINKVTFCGVYGADPERTKVVGSNPNQ